MLRSKYQHNNTTLTFNRRVPVVFQSAGDAVEQAGSGGLLRGQVRGPEAGSQVGHRDVPDQGPLLRDFKAVFRLKHNSTHRIRTVTGRWA